MMETSDKSNKTKLWRQLFCCVSRLLESDSEVIYSPRTSHIAVHQRNYDMDLSIHRHSFRSGTFSSAQSGTEVSSSMQISSRSGKQGQKKSLSFPKTAPAQFGCNSNVVYRRRNGPNYQKREIKRKIRSASQLSKYPTYSPPSSRSDMSRKAPDFSETNSVNLMYSREHVGDSNLKHVPADKNCFRSSDRMFLSDHPFEKSFRSRPQTQEDPGKSEAVFPRLQNPRPQSVVVVVQPNADQVKIEIFFNPYSNMGRKSSSHPARFLHKLSNCTT